MEHRIGADRPSRPAPGRYGRVSRDVAFHEAGHCVAAIREGVRVRGVRWNMEYAGGSWQLQGADTLLSDNRHQVVLAAGYVGEELGRGNRSIRRQLSAVVDTDSADFRAARLLSGNLDASVRRAHGILVESWAAVAALTDELVEGDMDGRAIARTVMRNLPYPIASELRQRWSWLR